MKFILILLFLVGNVIAFEIKENNQKVELDYDYLDGVYITDKNYKFNDDSEILIRFNTETPTLISEFEAKYFLELQEVLIIGYYVYKSEFSSIELLPSIIEEDNIKTAKPNWKKNQKKK